MKKQLIECLELDQAYFNWPWSPELWKNLCLKKHRIVEKRDEKGKIIGFALFLLSTPDSLAHLLKIIIHPKVRRKGYAKEILKLAILTLRQLNVEKVFLEVEGTNTPANKLYEQLGFDKIAEKKHFYGQGRSANVYLKKI